MHHFIWRRPYCHLKKTHSESLINRAIPPLFTKIAFVWLDERLPGVPNNVRGSGNNTKINASASWHLEKQSHLSSNIRKYKSTLSFYPCTQVCQIISCDRRVLKSSPQSATTQSFLCVLINLFCSPGLSEWVEMWKLLRDEYRLKLQ